MRIITLLHVIICHMVILEKMKAIVLVRIG